MFLPPTSLPPAAHGTANVRRRPSVPRSAATASTAVLFTFTSAACGALMGDPHPETQEQVTVTSPLIQEGERVPDRYTCHGAGVSPPLQWSGLPGGTESIALVVDDPDAEGGPLVHWVVADLDPDNHELPEGIVPSQADQARNSLGTADYFPLCPEDGGLTAVSAEDQDDTDEEPRDGPSPEDEDASDTSDAAAHTQGYRFTVYALRSELELGEGAPLEEALGAIADHTIAWGRLFAVGE